MKTIALSQGKVAIVDDEDFGALNRHKWSAYRSRHVWYAMRKVTLMSRGAVIEHMHRRIVGAAPGQQIDHINGDGLDNRRANLRFCTISENNWNSRKRLDNTSGYKGVSWDMSCKNFRAYIGIGGKVIRLGRYTDPVEAAKVYDAAALKYHGQFARLNFSACGGE